MFSLSYDGLNNVFFFLPYFIVRLQYVINVTYKLSANWLLVTGMVSSQCYPINQLSLVGVKSYIWIFDCLGVDTPNPHVVQG